MKLHERARAVKTRAELVAFIAALGHDLRGGAPWPNGDLTRYLDGLHGWVADLDGWAANRGQPVPEEPSWQLVAQMLLAATLYE